MPVAAEPAPRITTSDSARVLPEVWQATIKAASVTAPVP